MGASRSTGRHRRKGQAAQKTGVGVRWDTDKARRSGKSQFSRATIHTPSTVMRFFSLEIRRQKSKGLANQVFRFVFRHRSRPPQRWLPLEQPNMHDLGASASQRGLFVL